MQYRYEIDAERRLVISHISGVVTLSELEQTNESNAPQARGSFELARFERTAILCPAPDRRR